MTTEPGTAVDNLEERIGHIGIVSLLCSVGEQPANMVDERLPLHRQADFLPVGRSRARAVRHRDHFIATVGVRVGANDTQVAGLQFAHHLHAHANLELAPMQACRHLAWTRSLTGDQPPPLLWHPGQILQIQGR